MVSTLGAGVLIGHAAIAVLVPLSLVAFALGFRRHRQPLPLLLSGLAALIAYAHILGLVPEWAMFGVVLLATVAAIRDWQASRACTFRPAVVRTPRIQASP